MKWEIEREKILSYWRPPQNWTMFISITHIPLLTRINPRPALHIPQSLALSSTGLTRMQLIQQVQTNALKISAIHAFLFHYHVTVGWIEHFIYIMNKRFICRSRLEVRALVFHTDGAGLNSIRSRKLILIILRFDYIQRVIEPKQMLGYRYLFLRCCYC